MIGIKSSSLRVVAWPEEAKAMTTKEEHKENESKAIDIIKLDVGFTVENL